MIKKPRIKVPKSARKGEVFPVKTLMTHKMETGFRKDKSSGKLIARRIINRFECTYNGVLVFSMDLHPAISANPYVTFFVRAEHSGALEFVWTDDNGDTTIATRDLNVT